MKANEPLCYLLQLPVELLVRASTAQYTDRRALRLLLGEQPDIMGAAHSKLTSRQFT